MRFSPATAWRYRLVITKTTVSRAFSESSLAAFSARRLAANVVERAQVEHGLRSGNASVEDVVRPDNRGNPGKERRIESERGEIGRLCRVAHPRVHPRHQFAQGAEARAACAFDLLLDRDESEIVLQSALDRVGQRQRQRVGRGGSRRHAAGKRTTGLRDDLRRALSGG